MQENIQIIYKHIKNVNLKIQSDMTVIISVPYNMSQAQIQDILIKRQSWIAKHLEIMRLRQAKIKHLKEDGTNIVYLGQSYPIKLYIAKQERVQFDNIGNIYIGVKEISRKDIVLAKWRKQQSEVLFTRLIEQNMLYFTALSYTTPTLSIKKMTTRWGSYSKRINKVNLNIELLKYKLELINYVVVHELCHIVHQNHSKDFYNLMTKLLPNWALLRSELNYGVDD